MSINAEMAELADAQGSEPCPVVGVRVRLPLSALNGENGDE
jgi:hypothetical protein